MSSAISGSRSSRGRSASLLVCPAMAARSLVFARGSGKRSHAALDGAFHAALHPRRTRRVEASTRPRAASSERAVDAGVDAGSLGGPPPLDAPGRRVTLAPPHMADAHNSGKHAGSRQPTSHGEPTSPGEPIQHVEIADPAPAQDREAPPRAPSHAPSASSSVPLPIVLPQGRAVVSKGGVHPVGEGPSVDPEASTGPRSITALLIESSSAVVDNIS